LAQLVGGILICCVVGALWFAARWLSTTFVLHVAGGKVVKRRGVCSDLFIKDVERICAFWSVDAGRIEGVRTGTGMRIEVGGGVPKQHRQAFQNAWNYPIE